MFDYRLEEDASRFAVFYENEEIGSGRTATHSKMFISINHKSKCKIKMNNLFETVPSSEKQTKHQFYLHKWN